MKKHILILVILSLGCCLVSAQEYSSVRQGMQEEVSRDSRKNKADSLRLARMHTRLEQQVNFAEYNTARWAFSANIGNFATLFTLNGGIQYSIGRNFTAEATVDVNPWTFRSGKEGQFENRQQTYAVGMRFWPWYTYSGWWAGTKAQYQEYNRGGVASPETEEGDAFGLVIQGGYSVHVNRWLDIDFGFGFWGGKTWYTTYSCPHCGRVVDSGDKFFFLPNQAIVAAMFIF